MLVSSHLFHKFKHAVFWLGVLLIVAGITHIISILLMPRLAPNNAYQRFARSLPVNHLSLLAAQTDSAVLQAMPFRDPAMMKAICVFDVSAGAVRVRGQTMPDQVTTFSFHSNKGDVFYSLTDRSVVQGRVDIVLLNQAQLDQLEAADNEDEPVQELRILVPSQRGFAVIQTLAERQSQRQEAQARLGAMSCVADHSP
jgi:uncharacterized membrane protein